MQSPSQISPNWHAFYIKNEKSEAPWQCCQHTSSPRTQEDRYSQGLRPPAMSWNCTHPATGTTMPSLQSQQQNRPLLDVPYWRALQTCTKTQFISDCVRSNQCLRSDAQCYFCGYISQCINLTLAVARISDITMETEQSYMYIVLQPLTRDYFSIEPLESLKDITVFKLCTDTYA